jgi:hypothetical protein
MRNHNGSIGTTGGTTGFDLENSVALSTEGPPPAYITYPSGLKRLFEDLVPVQDAQTERGAQLSG